MMNAPSANISRTDAAGMLDVGEDQISYARVVLECGTKEEIARVMAGGSLRGIADKIRPRITSTQRHAGPKRDDISKVGKVAQRYEEQRIRGEVWSQLREALVKLTSLPLPSDVATIARIMDRKGLVDERLPKARRWMEEFSNVFNRNKAEGAKEADRDGRNNDGDARDGLGAS